jgi:hypothetical protein
MILFDYEFRGQRLPSGSSGPGFAPGALLVADRDEADEPFAAALREWLR